MDDPVITCDGFTFERNAIERYDRVLGPHFSSEISDTKENVRWFQIRHSSPLSGLLLDNTDLRSNGQIANEIKNWVEGRNLLQPPAGADTPSLRSGFTRPSSSQDDFMSIRFFSRLGSFSRRIPKTLSVNDLYRLAFQGTKGRNAKFELHCKTVFLAPSEHPVSATNVRNGEVIHIHVEETASASASTDGHGLGSTSDTGFEELCLIKVYVTPNQVLFSYVCTTSP